MIKTGFTYLKLTAVVLLLAMTLIPSVWTSTAKNQPSPMAHPVPDADLANEERVIARYADDLINYENDVQAQGKKAALVSTDLAPLERRSEDLKGRLSGVQNSFREIVRKLKAANEFDDVDTRVAARITDARQRAFFQESSFKQQLEENSNSLAGQASEISTPLDHLRRKLTSRYSAGSEVQILRASYEAPAPFTSGSLGCRIGRLGIKITNAVGGTVSKERSDRVFNRCYPDGLLPFN